MTNSALPWVTQTGTDIYLEGALLVCMITALEQDIVPALLSTTLPAGGSPHTGTAVPSICPALLDRFTLSQAISSAPTLLPASNATIRSASEPSAASVLLCPGPTLPGI